MNMARKETSQKGIDDRMRTAVQMSAEGKSYNEIAEKLGISTGTITQWFKRDDIMALRSNAAKRMVMTMSAKAYAVLSHQLDNSNPWIQLSAARELVRLADQYEQQDQTQVVVSFGSMPAPGAPKSADDEIDGAADQSFNAG